MSDATERDRDDERKLVLEYDLDASPEKVWRAVTVPALRARWLPQSDLAASEPVSSVIGEEICYRVREAEPPFLESSVTFRIEPNHGGGTRLRIIHQIDQGRLSHATHRAANNNRRCLMRAA
jgi:uncharacterized protein YndB with AHSA1/START domain